MVFQFARHSATSGRFVFISDASEAIFGVTPQEAQENPNRIFRLIHPEDLASTLHSMNLSVDDGQTWAHEFRIRLADGKVRTLFGKAITVMESTGQSNAYGSVTDITDHKASQAILQESEARFRALTELSSDWYWEQDAEFRFVLFAGALPLLKGREPNASIGKTRWDLPTLNMSVPDWNTHRADLQARRVFKDLELQVERADGRDYWMSVSGAPIFDALGSFKGYRGVGRDITARKRAEEEIERLAFFDVLTDLPNRRLLVDRLQQALVTSARDKAPGALLFIDLDNFKDLNDTQGHDVGDLLL
jgi:PAS domain S-box-containing protein